jgi:hypothetical protein
MSETGEQESREAGQCDGAYRAGDPGHADGQPGSDLTRSVSTQITGSPLPAIAWASSRLTKVLPTPPLP